MAEATQYCRSNYLSNQNKHIKIFKKMTLFMKYDTTGPLTKTDCPYAAVLERQDAVYYIWDCCVL